MDTATDHKTISPILAFYAPGSSTPKTYTAPALLIEPEQQSESRFFVNGFKQPVERIEAVIQCAGHVAKIVFRERLTSENKRRFWKGTLEKGAPSKMGISCILKVTQYDPGKFPRTNYGVTIEANFFTPKRSETLQPNHSPGLLSLFGGDTAA